MVGFLTRGRHASSVAPKGVIATGKKVAGLKGYFTKKVDEKDGETGSVLKSIPLVALLRKAQMARELVEMGLFLCLIVFMALSVYKFLGTAQTRIEANGFLKQCLEAAINDGNTPFDQMNYYGLSTSDSWTALQSCASKIVHRGIDLGPGPDPGVGTATINDFQKVMFLGLLQTKRYVETTCSAAERVSLIGQKCYKLETFDKPGTPFGPGGMYQREWINHMRTENGEFTKYNGSNGIWAYVQPLAYGPEVNLTNSLEVLSTLDANRFFDELTYKISLDVITYAVGYHEMNYVRLTFTRQTSDGGYRTAGFIPMIYSAPINPLIRDWLGYKRPLPDEDYDPTQRRMDGLAIQIVYAVFLLATWYITLRDAGNSLVEEWIEQCNHSVGEDDAIGSLTYVIMEKRESHNNILHRIFGPLLEVKNYANVWRHLILNHYLYVWNLLDLASNCVMTLNIVVLSLAIAYGRSSSSYREMPKPNDTDTFLFLDETNTEMAYVNLIQYTAAVSMILAAARMFRSLKDIPGIRVYSLLFYKAMPRLKDFFIFFILIIFFLSIAIFFVFDSTGGNPDFRSLGTSFGTLMSQTFGIYQNSFSNSRIGSANNNQIIMGIMWLVIILLNVIALNILLAIIVDAYSFATDDEALNKEASVMLEPSFLANGLTYCYYLCSIPFELLVPVYQSVASRIKRAKIQPRAPLVPTKSGPSFRIPPSTRSTKNLKAGVISARRLVQEIEDARHGGSDGDADDNNLYLDRDGDGAVDVFDDELALDTLDVEAVEAFESAVEGEDFTTHDTIDMRQVLTGFGLREVEFKVRGTNSAPSVQFLKYFLDADGIDRWDRHTRTEIYHPAFESYVLKKGWGSVRVSDLAYTPGLVLFSIPAKLGFKTLPLILLEWKLARDPKSQALLDFFEDATTNTLDDTVTDMALTEDSLLDYYCKAVKAAAQEDLIIDEIVHTMLRTPAAFILSLLSFELPLLVCHGYILQAIQEQLGQWINKLRGPWGAKQKGPSEPQGTLGDEEAPRGPPVPPPSPPPGGAGRETSDVFEAASNKSWSSESAPADPLATPEFTPDFDLLKVIMWIKDCANVFGRPNELQVMMKDNLEQAITQYSKWANIPLHRMEEAGSRITRLLESKSMQKALNQTSWNMVTRMSKADQDLRNREAMRTGGEDDDDDTLLQDFVAMAVEDYTRKKGWPGGLGDRAKPKIKKAIELGAVQMHQAIIAGTQQEEKSSLLRTLKSTRAPPTAKLDGAALLSPSGKGKVSRPGTHGLDGTDSSIRPSARGSGPTQGGSVALAPGPKSRLQDPQPQFQILRMSESRPTSASRPSSAASKGRPSGAAGAKLLPSRPGEASLGSTGALSTSSGNGRNGGGLTWADATPSAQQLAATGGADSPSRRLRDAQGPQGTASSRPPTLQVPPPSPPGPPGPAPSLYPHIPSAFEAYGESSSSASRWAPTYGNVGAGHDRGTRSTYQ